MATDQTTRLEAATVKAENGSQIISDFANGPATATVQTASGTIPTLAGKLKEISDTLAISSGIYPTTAAGLAATSNNQVFLVYASDDDDIIYRVYQNKNGTAFDTGKNTISGTDLEQALAQAGQSATAAQQSAAAAQASAASLADAIKKVDRIYTLDSPSGSDDTQVIQSAINMLQGKGGGILFIVGVWRYTTLTNDGTVSIYGIGPTRSVLIHQPPTVNTDGLVFQPTQSFLRPALNHFSHLCEGEGRLGIATPIDGGQFTRAFAIDFAGMSIRRSTGTSAGWSAALRIGDTVASSFKASEIRMGFDVSLDPAGQKDTVGVLLEAATANVAADLTGLQIVGCKYPVRIGENVEGYFLSNTELVNGLDGVSSVNTVSKPGGFHSNLHINCARYPIALQNRRDFNINGIQLYRGSGHFNGTAPWVGFKLDNCLRFNIDGQNFRVISGYSSKSHAFQVNGSTDIGLGSGVLGEDGGITDGITLNNCKAFFIDTQKMATGMATWLTMTGCSFGDVGKMVSQDATVPTTAYSIDATNAKRNIKVDRTDLDRLGYDEITYTAAATKVIQFTDGTPVRTFNLNAGTAAYTVDIQILRANHLPGMTYKFRVVMGASTNPTIRFLDDTTANVRRTIAGTTTQTIYEIELVFNNAGWVISRFVTSAA